mgnify:CR=1 FL=1
MAQCRCELPQEIEKINSSPANGAASGQDVVVVVVVVMVKDLDLDLLAFCCILFMVLAARGSPIETKVVIAL